MKEKKEKKPNGKVTIKTSDAVNAYNLLNQQKRDEKEVKGVRLSALETADIFKVLYIVKALKPIATAYTDFRNDVEKRFEPEGFAERRGKYETLPDTEKQELEKEFAEYQKKVNECMDAEWNKEQEIEAYERLDKDAFGKLVKDNGHILYATQIALLMDVMV